MRACVRACVRRVLCVDRHLHYRRPPISLATKPTGWSLLVVRAAHSDRTTGAACAILSVQSEMCVHNARDKHKPHTVAARRPGQCTYTDHISHIVGVCAYTTHALCVVPETGRQIRSRPLCVFVCLCATLVFNWRAQINSVPPKVNHASAHNLPGFKAIGCAYTGRLNSAK